MTTTSTGHAKLNAILSATLADSRKAKIRTAGFFTRVVMLAGAILCIAMGQPADTLERLSDDRAAL